MPDVDVVDLGSQTVVGTRTQTDLTRIGEDIGRGAAATAAALGPAVAGPCVALYMTWEETSGEILVGFPSAAAPPAGCAAEELPAGRAAVLVHLGAYDGLAGSWAAIKAGMAERGLTGRAPPWEEYLNDCSITPPDDLRTRIVWPID